MGSPKKRSRRRYRSRQSAHAKLGQHFFRSGSIARQIVRSIGLENHQSALELCAGKGFFTTLIAPEVRSLTAIDIDPQLIASLNALFGKTSNVRVVRKGITSNIDYGAYDVVFGNIPFNRTANVFRKVVQPPVRFESCHLIVQTEAAYRLLGSGRPTEMAVLAYPFVEVKIGMNIPRSAYRPAPSVDSVLMHIRTRRKPLVSRSEYREFSAFVKSIIRSVSRKMSRVIGDGISYARWRRICAAAGINPSDSHLELDMPQYMKLFRALRG